MTAGNAHAERGLIGILLNHNPAIFEVGFLQQGDFLAERIHGELLILMRDLIEAGRMVTAVTMVHDAQDAFVATDLKCSEYLQQLEDEAPRGEPELMLKLAREMGITIRDTAAKDRYSGALSELAVWVNDSPPSVSGAEVREHIETTLAALSTSVEDIGFQKLGDVGDAMLESLKTVNAPEVGFMCGPTAVRDLIGPLFPEDVYYLAGAPGAAKSALALQMARDAARQGKQVAIFSPEMGAAAVTARALAADTGVSDVEIRRGGITNSEYEALWEANEKLKREGVYVDRTSSPTIATIRSRCMRKKRLGGLDLVIIDHIGLMGKLDRRSGEPDSWMVNCSGIKQLANDLHIPIIPLVQFGTGQLRDMATWPHRRPITGDILYSGTVWQNADVILLLHREETVLKQAGEPAEGSSKPTRVEWLARKEASLGRIEAILGKRRSGGEGTGSRTFYFNAPRYTFSDRDFRAARIDPNELPFELGGR